MIVVFGSINLDLVTRVPRIPGPGETVKGPGYALIPGGKGANQALAAALAGARVTLVGAKGRDLFADLVLEHLTNASVDCSHVRSLDAPTGAAFISVDANGHNAITVASGANGEADADWLEALSFGPGDTLLLQGELPPGATLAAARHGREKGARVILNTAPSENISADLIEAVDIVVMNEGEAFDVAEAFGWDPQKPEDVAERIDTVLGRTGIVTLGGQGAIGWSGGVRRAVPAPAIEVVDTTGAGDTFCGFLAAALERSAGLGAAMHKAVIAGSLTCMRAGAQISFPNAAEVAAFAEKEQSSEDR